MRRRRRPRTRPSPADNLRVWLMDWYGWEARHVRGSSPRAITKVLLIMLSSPVNSGRASLSRSMDSCSQKTNEMPLVGQLTPSYAFTTHGRSLQLKVTIFQQFLLRAGRRGCESAQHCTSNWSHIPANAYDFDLSH